MSNKKTSAIDAIRTACPTLAALLPAAELAQLVAILSPHLARQTYRLDEAARLFGKTPCTLWRWSREYGGVFVPGRDPKGKPNYTPQQIEAMAAVVGGQKTNEDAAYEWALEKRVQSGGSVERTRKPYTRRAHAC